MAVTIGDIDIFVLSCNRGDMIAVTLQSLLNQSVPPARITVLDNASTDHTAAAVASLGSDIIDFQTLPENKGALPNFMRCQQLTTGRFVMAFHDDDQLHPRYLETALHWLNRYPETGVLVPNKMNIEAGVAVQDPPSPDPAVLRLDRRHFATALYIRNQLAFPGAVYAAESWRRLKLPDLNAHYGKWCDRPILIEAVQENQSALILQGSWVFYGRHAQQDTKAGATQPPHTMWLNREAYYHELLGDSWGDLPGQCFRVMNPRNLKSGFKRRIAPGTDMEEYLTDALSIGATTERLWKLRFLYPKPVQKGFNGYAWACLRHRFAVT